MESFVVRFDLLFCFFQIQELKWWNQKWKILMLGMSYNLSSYRGFLILTIENGITLDSV